MGAEIPRIPPRWPQQIATHFLLPWVLLPHAPPLAPPQTTAAEHSDAFRNAEERLPDKKGFDNAKTARS